MVTLFRSRWAAVGAAVAVTLGGGGLIGVSAADTSSTLVPIAPVRVLDTRASEMVGDINDGASITVQVTGSIATVSEGTKTVVPSGASAITGNMTLVSTTSNDFGGFATIYPCGTRPDASNINFTSGQTVANSVAVPLSASGTVCIYVFGTAHVLLDVSGYYTNSEISNLADDIETLQAITRQAVAYDQQGTPVPLYRNDFLAGISPYRIGDDFGEGAVYVKANDRYWQATLAVFDNVSQVILGTAYPRFFFKSSDCSGDPYLLQHAGNTFDDSGNYVLPGGLIGDDEIVGLPFVGANGTAYEEDALYSYTISGTADRGDIQSRFELEIDGVTCVAVDPDEDYSGGGGYFAGAVVVEENLGIEFPLVGSRQ